MTSMDKRRGSRIGRPAKQINMHVVLKQAKEGGDIAIDKIYTTAQKADMYIIQQNLSDSPYGYFYQKWAAE